MKKDLQLFLNVRTSIITTLIETISTQGFRPYITCFTEAIANLPEHIYSEKVVTLDVSVEAVGSFHIDENNITVTVRFAGKPIKLIIPLLSILKVSAFDEEKVVMVIEPNNSFGISNDLANRYFKFYENGWVDSEKDNDTSTPVKQKPTLYRVK